MKPRRVLRCREVMWVLCEFHVHDVMHDEHVEVAIENPHKIGTGPCITIKFCCYVSMYSWPKNWPIATGPSWSLMHWYWLLQIDRSCTDHSKHGARETTHISDFQHGCSHLWKDIFKSMQSSRSVLRNGIVQFMKWRTSHDQKQQSHWLWSRWWRWASSCLYKSS